MDLKVFGPKLEESRKRCEEFNRCDHSHGLPTPDELPKVELIALVMETIKTGILDEDWQYVFDAYVMLEILNPPIAASDKAG